MKKSLLLEKTSVFGFALVYFIHKPYSALARGYIVYLTCTFYVKAESTIYLCCWLRLDLLAAVSFLLSKKATETVDNKIF